MAIGYLLLEDYCCPAISALLHKNLVKYFFTFFTLNSYAKSYSSGNLLNWCYASIFLKSMSYDFLNSLQPLILLNACVTSVTIDTYIITSLHKKSVNSRTNWLHCIWVCRLPCSSIMRVTSPDIAWIAHALTCLLIPQGIYLSRVYE